MRIARSTLVRAGIALGATAALALVVTAGYVLPGRARALDAERHALSARLNRASGPGPRVESAVRVPDRAGLPARTAVFLDQIAAAGARDLRYTAGGPAPGAPPAAAGVAAQSLEVGFVADLEGLGRILSGLEAAAPAVTVTGVELEGDAGHRVGVTLHLWFLGAA